MKPATYTETLVIVREFARGRLKQFLVGKHMEYHCAMKRISRFRQEYPAVYRRAVKMSTFVNRQSRTPVID